MKDIWEQTIYVDKEVYKTIDKIMTDNVEWKTKVKTIQVNYVINESLNFKFRLRMFLHHICGIGDIES